MYTYLILCDVIVKINYTKKYSAGEYKIMMCVTTNFEKKCKQILMGHLV